MTEIRHIVFDLGNVLIHWDPERPYRRLIPDDAERKRFLAEVCNSAWLKEMDAGATWADGEVALIQRYPDHEAMIRAFRAHWHEMVPHALDDTVEVLEALIESGHDVTALSNWAADTFEEAAGRFAFLERFRGITVSGRVRLVKPDQAIYLRHVEDFRLEPNATLFFDDVLANVEAARAAGWNAEVFEGAPKLRADLERYGVTIRP